MIEQLKEKYPLAVGALKNVNFISQNPENRIATIVNDDYENITIEVITALNIDPNCEKQSQIGEMLADILNLIAK